MKLVINRKIVVVGNSYGVTIPKQILDALNKKVGDKIVLEIKEVK
jgi:antitoxin component of MazEF toxin-antitoxin module